MLVVRPAPPETVQRHSLRLWRESSWRARWTSRVTSAVVHLLILLTLPRCDQPDDPSEPTVFGVIWLPPAVELSPAASAPTPTPTSQPTAPPSEVVTPPVSEPVLSAQGSEGEPDPSLAPPTDPAPTALSGAPATTVAASAVSDDRAALTTPDEATPEARAAVSGTDAAPPDAPGAVDGPDAEITAAAPAAAPSEAQPTAAAAPTATTATSAPTHEPAREPPASNEPPAPTGQLASTRPDRRPPHPPQPTPPPTPDDWLRYAHTSTDGAAPIDPNAAMISAHTTSAPQDQRTRVISPVEGPKRPNAPELEPAPWSPGLVKPTDRPQDTRGDDMYAEQTTERPPTPQSSLEPPTTTETPPGGPSQAGAAGSIARAPSAQQAAGQAGRQADDGAQAPRPGGYQQAVRGSDASGPNGREGWNPTASRVKVVSRPAAPASAPGALASAEVAASAAAAPSASAPRTPGSPRTPATVKPAEPTELPPVEAPEPAPEVLPDPVSVDPVAALRASLGWGRTDRTQFRPRNADEGKIGAPASADGSEQTVLPDDATDVVAVNAVATPLGRYTAEVERAVRTRWYEVELDPLQRALGDSGAATVQFYVRQNGKVSDVKLTRSSGSPYLDAMALSAIPTTLPRMPRELALDGLHHRISLAYHNQLAAQP